jgi:hypothetical protein
VDFYFGDQCHSGEGRAISGEVERTRLITIASVLMAFALVVLEGPQLAQPAPAAEDRFLVLFARSLGRSRRASSGRVDPFAAQFGYDRHLRNPAEDRSRREGSLRIATVDIVGNAAARGRRQSSERASGLDISESWRVPVGRRRLLVCRPPPTYLRA